jgi:hypothetical protein
VENEQQIRDAAASFMKQYDWNWWCTLTFTNPPSWDVADLAFRKWINKLNRRTFGNNYYKRPTEGLRWLRGVELQQREAIHFHVRVAGDPKPAWDIAEKFWGTLAGDAQITPYDPDRGATYYLVKKYAADGNLDLGGPWKHIAPQLSGVVRRPTRGT